MQKNPSEKTKVLVVDDNQVICGVLQATIELLDGVEVDCASSLEEARSLIARTDYFIAVADFYLPDSAQGELIDLLLSQSIPTIVLTGSVDKSLYQSISGKSVVDYVVKQSPGAIESVKSCIARILKNIQRTVLVVDDSASIRAYLKALLHIQCLNVMEAKSAEEALEIVKNNSVDLILTDYDMGKMNGVAMTVKLRGRYKPSKLGIIGVTGSGDEFVVVQFLKAGANDILRKPFLPEELIGRINNCLDHLDDVKAIEDHASRDFLTKLHNRRYFFGAGATLFNNARRKNITISVAMIDIDHFKRINDTYGHDVGDMAIVAVANLLSENFRKTDVVARFGGEEFCVIMSNAKEPEVVMERMRSAIADIRIDLPGGEILSFTGSIGLCETLKDTLEDMVTAADKALYISKESGRNRVTKWVD